MGLPVKGNTVFRLREVLQSRTHKAQFGFAAKLPVA